MTSNDPAIIAAKRLARELDPDPTHAFQVAKLALQLFDETNALHGLDNEARRLLHIAALLHDTGHSISIQGHHKHSRDIILESAIPQLAGADLPVVASIARYHRKGHPKPDHKVYRDLSPEGQSLVQRLAAILRVADGLDRTHQTAAKAVRCQVSDNTVQICVHQRRPNDTDLWGAERKSALFEESFQMRLTFSQAQDTD